MKLSLFAILLTFGTLHCLPVLGQSTPTTVVEQPQLSGEYISLLREAGVEFQNRNLDKTLQILDEADTITLDNPIALNLRGAVYTEKKDYSKAEEYFNRALEKAPNYFEPQYNRGEVLFIQKKYDEARAHFEKMLEKFPENELLQYKIALTYLEQDNIPKATEWQEKIKFPSNSPAYYFAKAALNFKSGKKQEAIGWIASSEKVFSTEINAVYLESLADLGYVNRPEDPLPPAE